MNKNFNIKYRHLKTEINIIPLLDVLLVLLIMVMTTTTITFQKIDIELPITKNFKSILNTNNSTILVEILDIRKYRIIINDNIIENVSNKNITLIIKNYLLLNSNSIFLIASVKNIPYYEIINLLSLLRKAGAKSISLITKKI